MLRGAGMTDTTEIRKRLNASLDLQRERLARIDDQTLVVLVDHVRELVADPRFDPLDFLGYSERCRRSAESRRQRCFSEREVLSG
jgi:hypothetical protein